MSKRARLSTEESKRAGLHAWETNDGRRWLMKSLNPNDVAITSTGIPTLASHNISVLNWQGEFTAGVPTLSANISSYDTTMYLYQHPVIFGMSASRPQGTIDLREAQGRLELTYDLANKRIVLSIAEGSNQSDFALSTCKQYLNKQLDPTIFKLSNTVSGRSDLFASLSQKSRICYGGATIIPTCSDENNSGSLAVCQQVFNPRRSVVPNYPSFGLWTYDERDFPDTSDTVQNPQMYYGRYQDGAYVPYKLVNPSDAEYVNSENKIITRAPYYVSKITLIGHRPGDKGIIEIKTGDFNNNTTEDDQVRGQKFYFDISSYMGGTDQDPAYPGIIGVRFYVMLYTGQSGFFTITKVAEKAGLDTPIFTTEDGTTTVSTIVKVTATDTPYMEGTTLAAATSATAYDFLDSTTVTRFIQMPALITASNTQGSLDTDNPDGTWYVSQDDGYSIDPSYITPICPYNGSRLAVIHMSGISSTAPIKMILRYGVEILLTASSIYSPFRFMSPKYDESAIKSYARCIRTMKDAYFANAGSTIGQVDFVNKILNMLETDAPDDLRVMNQGGQWTGVVV